MCVEDAENFGFLHSPAETGTFERASESPLRGVIWSMSSMKRDVKKKLLPRAEGERFCVSISSPLTVGVARFGFLCVRSSLPVTTAWVEFYGRGKRD
jgi:hypothetical protein